ncbi:TPA: helix-turn-helix domain-containing protein [Raoultella ornithinolytica]|nr:helix-turn-helix domain-containing protein [Raoultella ornithinolytica]HEC2585577.1 helix-turn-helix domain-containing protein [Raoultella ornithinolytica]HEC2621477.1 helix-turn-helix domain-containing protein [Raoultella ornithinolytica]
MCFALTQPAFYPPSTGERKKLVSILKRSGLTLTTSRINLLHHLTQTQLPLTAFDLSRLVNIPLSTTHRNLSAFADFGLVDYIIDRSSVCRWYLLTTGRANYCPTCHQTFNAAY